MAKTLISTTELAGTRVFAGKNGTKRIGKVRSFVFHPQEKRCIGFIVKRPDLLLMFRRKDKFVSIEGYDFVDGRIVIRDVPEATDRAACKALGVDWDSCVLWVGLPVMTQDGQALGTVGAVSFNRVTGRIDSLETNSGATANALLGKREIPASCILGFKRGVGAELAQLGEGVGQEAVYGAILVSDEAVEIAAEGGLAEQAGKATAVAADKAQAAVDKVKPAASAAVEKTGEVINKGAYATGKQISKTKTMFSDFKDEYDKARGPKPSRANEAELAVAKPKAKAAKAAGSQAKAAKASAAKASGGSASESAGKAVGNHLKKAGGMFSAFKDEYDKARRDDT